MKAQVLREFGGPSNMSLEDVPVPMLGEGQVLIDVHAAGVNFADILMCQGKYQETPDLPFTPGMEISGIVVEMGPRATGVYPGDKVMAKVPAGGFAEQIAVDATDCWLAPPELTMVQTAGFPLAYGTSHVALTHRAKVQKGEVLLVHGAAGGVGLTAVEIGKALGATVIATAGSDEKLALTKVHGADHVINYRSENIRDRVKEMVGGVDVVYDPVGGDVFKQSMRCINPEGRMIVVGFAAGDVQQIPANHLLVKNVDVLGFYWGGYANFKPEIFRQSFKELAKMVARGDLNPHVSHEIALEDAPRALELLASRKSTGKVVIKVRD